MAALFAFILCLAPPAGAEMPAEKAAALVAARRAEVAGHLEAGGCGRRSG